MHSICLLGLSKTCIMIDNTLYNECQTDNAVLKARYHPTKHKHYATSVHTSTIKVVLKSLAKILQVIYCIFCFVQRYFFNLFFSKAYTKKESHISFSYFFDYRQLIPAASSMSNLTSTLRSAYKTLKATVAGFCTPGSYNYSSYTEEIN